jgi:hypothetical protein
LRGHPHQPKTTPPLLRPRLGAAAQSNRAFGTNPKR